MNNFEEKLYLTIVECENDIITVDVREKWIIINYEYIYVEYKDKIFSGRYSIYER